MLAISIVEGAALIFLGLLVVGLLRSHAEILRRLHEMGEGLEESPAPTRIRVSHGSGSASGAAYDLMGTTLSGETISVGLVGARENTLLAFLSATCYTCEPFWDALSEGVEVPGNARVIAVVQAGDNVARLLRLAGPDLLVVVSDDAWAAYEVPGSPHFVYVDGPTGRAVGEGTASSWQQVRDLIDHATSATPPGGPQSIDLLPPGRDNPDRIDRELLAAGIGPGHLSLYPDLVPDPDATS